MKSEVINFYFYSVVSEFCNCKHSDLYYKEKKYFTLMDHRPQPETYLSASTYSRS